MSLRHAFAAAALIAAAAPLFASPSLADRGGHDRDGAARPVTHAATLKECGQCHMAFPAALLPAAGWDRLMDTLPRHFGEDASLPAEVAADIRAYLTANAARRGDTDTIRITEQRWWLREHDFRPQIWERPHIRSKANCEACHDRAGQGVFEDE
ncbi:cytochrome c [Rhodospirillum centenum]|uniref:DHC, diheme Cytochrome c n=1 Tax=Rhodospirillum centenum (strain ATCC 51521 / SW) TaxID=414684 RepID=B6IR21_RHOCS|nr:cytochrome c [Rhodospirillum centenum]ACI97907.1 DHC, diheme Cytochrome c [Rhodospirillum centenum SW]